MKRTLVLILSLLFSQLSCGQEAHEHLIDQALGHQIKGQYQEAIEGFSSYLAIYPTEKPIVYRHRGFSYYHLEKYQQAIGDFKKAVELAPGQTDASFALGKIYYRLGNYDASLRYFDMELSYHPKNAHALNDRGLIKCQIRDYDSAIDDFEGAFGIDPTFAMAYNNAGAAKYYNQDIDNPIKNDIESAKDYFSKAITLDPTLGIAYRNRGAMNLFLQLLDEAVSDLNIAGKLQPHSPIIPFYKGIVLIEKGTPIAAVAELKKAIEIDPNFVFAYEEMGDIYYDKSQFDDALGYYQKAITNGNAQPKIYKGLIHYKIATVHASLGEKSKMYSQLAIAKKYDAFRDKKVYQRFLKTAAFRSFRSEKKFRKFTKSVTKLKKEYKFLNSDLRWFRMND